MSEILSILSGLAVPLLFIGGWILLQTVVLPRMGVGT